MDINNLVKTSFNHDDVVVLLKDLTKIMTPLSVDKRERMIQSGIHYSEMLPEESIPSERHMKLYYDSLKNNSRKLAEHIGELSEIMIRNSDKTPVLVSLARAGTPIGILIKRYIKQKYNIVCPHYTISIIRDKGIDCNALQYIYNNEISSGNHSISDIKFIDGWIGKGAIQLQLNKSIDDLILKNNKWQGIESSLYVISDPTGLTNNCATRSDYLIPCACLNSIVSGLISRTILNKYISKNDFHGAVYMRQMQNIDETLNFLDTVSSYFAKLQGNDLDKKDIDCTNIGIVEKIMKDYNISDINKIKPGIGETSRVLLRRIPWKILISNRILDSDPDIQLIKELCIERNVPLEYYNLGEYKTCGIIKELNDV